MQNTISRMKKGELSMRHLIHKWAKPSNLMCTVLIIKIHNIRYLSCKYGLIFTQLKIFQILRTGLKCDGKSHCSDWCWRKRIFHQTIFQFEVRCFLLFLFSFLHELDKKAWAMVYSKLVSFELRLKDRVVDEHMKNSSRAFAPRVQHLFHYLGLQR